MSEDESNDFDDIQYSGCENGDGGSSIGDDLQIEDDSKDSPSFADECNKLALKHIQAWMKMQQEYADYIRTLTKYWFWFIVCAFALSGVSNLFGRLFLSDKVLVMLITGTSVGVIFGLVSTIIKALFFKKM